MQRITRTDTGKFYYEEGGSRETSRTNGGYGGQLGLQVGPHLMVASFLGGLK